MDFHFRIKQGSEKAKALYVINVKMCEQNINPLMTFAITGI
jgi:hypothetical protein